MMDTQYEDVSRITVVFEDGTVWEKYGAFRHGVELHLQDGERTLKIFPRREDADIDGMSPQPDERRQGIADFVNEQSVQYRRHSADAVQEDKKLATEQFGVDPRAAGWEEW